VNEAAQFAQKIQLADAVLVTVLATRGSVPRDIGTWMAVFGAEAVGTIGGGRLELDALAHARRMLQGDAVDAAVLYRLGPSLGQCCGGEVRLGFERVGARDVELLERRWRADDVPVALFGAGHVGLALVRVLTGLPVRLHWIDSRDEVFPPDVAPSVRCEHSQPVHAAVASLGPHSRVVIMSFSHAEDMDIVAACLQRQRDHADLPYVGLIGSETKWASFRQRLNARGFSDAELAHVTCPIGIPGIADKRPEVIAIGVAAQLLQVPHTSTIQPAPS
jgi:xanthine dehydrogenase accessory factor